MLDNSNKRRNELDLLRIFAVVILIFYHTGMLYVKAWGFHFKSDYQSSSLAAVMLVVEPWRMSLLWLISGVALRYVLDKYGAWHSVQQRALRLLLPLIFGVLVVVPPQLFVEMAGKGQLPGDFSYLDFYRAFWNLDEPLFKAYPYGILPHMDVNHLWYLRELFKFSLALMALHFIWAKLRLSLVHTRFAQIHLPRSGILMSALLASSLVVLDIVHLDERETVGALFLVAGFTLAKHAEIWQSLYELRRRYLSAALILFPALICIYIFVYLVPERMAQPWADPLSAVVYRLYAICCVFAALGYARHYAARLLSFTTKWSDAVLPVYIVHQTLILIAAYALKPWQLGVWLEAGLVLFLSFLGSYWLYLLVSRVAILGVFFGLRWPLNKSHPGTRLAQFLAYVLLIPLALKLAI